MERLSSIASKTFVDNLRIEIKSSDAGAVVANTTTLADPKAKTPAKLVKRDGHRDCSAEREAARLNTSDRVADSPYPGETKPLEMNTSSSPRR